jgi:hypothetical protein
LEHQPAVRIESQPRPCPLHSSGPPSPPRLIPHKVLNSSL